MLPVQPLGIMIEDAVQEAFRRFRGNTKQCSTLWTRLIGYLWVWGFLTLVAPLYNFPLFQYQVPTKNGVPFSASSSFANFRGDDTSRIYADVYVKINIVYCSTGPDRLQNTATMDPPF